MTMTLPSIRGRIGWVMPCFPLDLKKTEMSVKKKQVCGGWKYVGKPAFLSKLANINYPVTVMLPI